MIEHNHKNEPPGNKEKVGNSTSQKPTSPLGKFLILNIRRHVSSVPSHMMIVQLSRRLFGPRSLFARVLSVWLCPPPYFWPQQSEGVKSKSKRQRKKPPNPCMGRCVFLSLVDGQPPSPEQISRKPQFSFPVIR